jgi:serine/threonine-protein kinase PknG
LNASAIPDPNKRVASLRQIVQQYPKSKEALLRLANSLIDVAASNSSRTTKIPVLQEKSTSGKAAGLTAQSEYREVEEILTQVEALDPWDWRILWYKGRSFMAQKKAKEAQAAFDQVYFDLPGELVPKLALGLAAEMANNYKLAIHMYDLVSRTDPSYVSAAFGLARCLCATGDKKGAVAALERVPQSSNLFTRARVEIARTLINSEKTAPGAEELKAASMAVEALTLEGMEHHRLTRQVLETALNLVTSAAVSPNSSIKILGQTLQEVNLRIGLEKSLRAMAHLSTGDEKIRLVDEANRVRPRTLF